MLVVTDLLVLESFVLGSCLGRSGHNVPINLQQDKYYSLFYNFLSLCEWKSTFKGQSFEKGPSCIFQAKGQYSCMCAKSLQSCLDSL